MKHNIVTIAGTRPNWIKIDREISQTIINTSQHYDYEMAGIFFKELKLPKPDFNLGIKGVHVGKMIDKIRPILRKLQPQLVMVYGDTHSTLAGALAAAYEKIPVAHVEAGVRCGRMDMPEEINRILVDRIATFKFAPDNLAVKNLQDEGIRENVFNVGDVLFDAMNPFCPIKKTKNNGKYILLTIHREENDDFNRVNNILGALQKLQLPVIWPRHPRMKYVGKMRNIKIIEPVGYKKMLELESNAKHIVTDSGGVQREAFWMNIPCSILRRETEWPDAVNLRWAFLVDDDPDKIVDSIKNFHRRNAGAPDFMFGARSRIRKVLTNYL